MLEYNDMTVIKDTYVKIESNIEFILCIIQMEGEYLTE